MLTVHILIDLLIHHYLSRSFLRSLLELFTISAGERSSGDLTSGKCSHGSGAHSPTASPMFPSPTLIDSTPSPPPPLIPRPRLLAGSRVMRTLTRKRMTYRDTIDAQQPPRKTGTRMQLNMAMPVPAVRVRVEQAQNRRRYHLRPILCSPSPHLRQHTITSPQSQIKQLQSVSSARQLLNAPR